MTKIIGILPAGGTAARFGGLAKELLPVSQTECALSRMVRTLTEGGAEQVILCSSWCKVSLHMRAVAGLPVHIIARDWEGVWETIVEAAKTEADWYLFAMPDTVFPVNAFQFDKIGDAWVGLFQTFHPERFGVISDRRIVDKRQDWETTGPFYAWGAWAWSARAMQYLSGVLRETRDHTAGLNMMLRKFPAGTFPLGYYYDFADFDSYRTFLEIHKYPQGGHK